MNQEFERRVLRVQENAKLSLKNRMEERERDIVTRCVVAYKANKIDANQLYGAIAAIAELRSIAIEVEHDQLAAQREVENLTQGK